MYSLKVTHAVHDAAKKKKMTSHGGVPGFIFHPCTEKRRKMPAIEERETGSETRNGFSHPLFFVSAIGKKKLVLPFHGLGLSYDDDVNGCFVVLAVLPKMSNVYFVFPLTKNVSNCKCLVS